MISVRFTSTPLCESSWSFFSFSFDEDDDDPFDGVGEEDLGTICRYDGERVVIKVRIDKIVSTAIARAAVSLCYYTTNEPRL